VKRPWPLSSGVSWLAPAVLLALLATLATLQYRWAGELSEAEGARLRASARSRAEAMGRDFDRELTRAFQHLQLEPQALRARDFAAYAREYSRWRAESSHPDLVKDVLLIERERGEGGAVRLSRFDAAQATFVPSAWPPELAPLQERTSGRGRGPMGLVVPEVPAVLIPLAPGPPPRGPGLGPGPPPGEGPPPGQGVAVRREPPPRGFGPPDFVVLVLDLAYVRERFLPALAERHFGGPHGLDYTLAVVTADRPPREVWRSSPGGALAGAPDATAALLELRFEEAGGPGRRFVFGGRGGPPGPPGPPQRSAAWRLVAVHAGGSIDHAVAVARWRNLAVGLGILLLLGGSVAVMVAAARRAERLARQEMEFVAGVSHDLRTPLAVIRSAGENLADGLVQDTAQVKSYGALVRDEGRRLSDMVEQVLELAGADARRAREAAPVEVAALLDDALRACEPELRAAGVVAEKSVPAGLPRVMGDAGALRRAVRNLVENAVKYGGDARWIGVRAGEAAGEREVWVAVEDRGPGVAPEELPRIFEPFYRGRDAAAREIRGSGLGLSLVRRIVESHGGRVTVERGRERGSVFTIRLPALAEGAGAGPA
jgi:signal transduction histidine kinase